MKRFTDLVTDCLADVTEIFPWDADELLQGNRKPLLVDIREQDEYDAMHIEGALHVPRGILESSCEYNYEETVPELVEARERDVIVVCRSGNRSQFACEQLAAQGFDNVANLSGGMFGW